MNELSVLAEFSSGLKYEDLPESVVNAAKYCILDSIGCALGGSHEEEIPQLIEELRQFDDAGSIRGEIWGYPDRLSIRNALLMNGCMAHVLELDDVHTLSKSHVGAVVVTTAWTVARALGCSGKEFLEAVVAGYEVMARVGKGMDVSSNRKRGWHTTGVIGTFGAAAVSAKLMKLNAKKTLNAFGLAGTQSAGLWAFLAEGATCKKLHPAKACTDGFLAAMLADGGMTGPEMILDAKDGGLYRAVSDSFDLSKLTENLGKDFAVLSIDKKPYPCCRTTHHAIDSALALKKQGVAPDDIEKIEIDTYDIGVLQCGSQGYPKSTVEAKFSFQYTTAAALVFGQMGLAELKPDAIANPEVRRLAECTEVRSDQLFTDRYPKRWGSRTTVTLKDGSVKSVQTDDMSGSVKVPLSKEQEENKFYSLGSASLRREVLEKLFTAILSVENLNTLPGLGLEE